MRMTRRGLHMEPGETIRFTTPTRDFVIQANPSWNCKLCVIYRYGGCARFACTSGEIGGKGVHFVEVGKEDVV